MPESHLPPRQPRSAAGAWARIRAGTEPWVAVGDFLDEWRRTPPAERPGLVAEPPALAEEDSALLRWAALLAAAVEWLCWNERPTRLDPPAWTSDPRFRLPEPWFLYPGWRLRAMQLADTPAPFKMRNIFGGDRILDRV